MASFDSRRYFPKDVLPEAPAGMVSKRCSKTLSFSTFANHLWTLLDSKQHDPKGVIDLSKAVNSLMEKEILAKVNKGNTLTLTSEYQYYPTMVGILELRKAIANFLTRHFKPSQEINPNNLVVMSGVTSCMDTLSHILCDPGDVVITPTPAYGRTFTNFIDRSAATVVPLPCSQEENFAFVEEKLESLIKSQINMGRRVRVVVLLHPHNPLGCLYTTDQLQNVMAICAKYEIHLIMDEIYAFTIHDKETEFNSVFGMESVPDPQRTHILWGLSKDFALPGFRLGVIHTVNPWVLAGLKTLSHYHSTASLTQHATATLLDDIDWCDNYYLPTNRVRLAAAYHKARNYLEGIGVKVHKAVAGVYLWVNMQAFLNPCDRDSEMELFKAFLDGGVAILPGHTLFCPEYGWYRVVFAIQEDILNEGLARIKAVLSEWKQKKRC